MNGWQGALNILRKTHEEATEVTACLDSKGNTLPETNMGPENGWLEYNFPIGARPIFRGYVSFRVHFFFKCFGIFGYFCGLISGCYFLVSFCHDFSISL